MAERAGNPVRIWPTQVAPATNGFEMNRMVGANFHSVSNKTHSSERTARSELARPRILAVDDDARTTRLIKLLLAKRGGYEVLEENDPARAHQTAQDFRPDVILLDVMMPDLDGGAVAAQNQQDPKLR